MAFLAATSLALSASPSLAQSATWTGSVSNDYSTAGNWNPAAAPTAQSNLTIDNGDAVQAATELRLGDTGTGSLTISDGSSLTNQASVVLGRQPGGNGTVTVDGTNSAWSVGGDLYVGSISTGVVSIDNGGGLTSEAATYIGNRAGSTGAVTVSGPGSSWTTQGDLTVGNNGTAGVTIDQGAVFTSNAAVTVGRGATGTGDLTVDGVGSTWTVDGVLSVGNSSTGTLTVSDGGALTTNGVAYLGNVAGSSGTATVTGAGSNWTTKDDFTVGYNGTGTLTVEQGAALTNEADVLLGRGAAGTGTVTVTGAGSAWAVDGLLSVGNSGTGTLTVSDGGALTTGGLTYLGNVGGSSGTATVTGAGSNWTTQDDLTVGAKGTGTLTVEQGATLTSSTDATLGHGAAGTGTATVDGAGSAWTVEGILSVGNSGTGTLTVSDGGALTTTGLTYLGNVGGSSGAATITGPGSNWTTQDDLTVGANGTGTLTVEQGATLASGTDAFVGRRATGTGTATVDGAGSAWTVDGLLSVGNAGTGTLTVSDGGALTTTGLAYLGNVDGSSGAATITGPGSNWTTQSDFTIGYNGTGTLTVDQGATLTSNVGAIVGRDATGTGDATVDGAGSAWNITGLLSVGNAGAGTLTVSDGGAVTTSGEAYLGNVVGGQGTASVDGAGSSWSVGENLYVGGNYLDLAGIGDLSVTDGALLDIGGQMTIYSTGTVTIDQSTLSVQSIDNRGSLVLQDTQVNAPLALAQTAETKVLGTVDFLKSVTGGGNFTGTGKAVFHDHYKPADGVATPSFGGDVTFAAGSTFQVDVASDGTSDRIDVAGTATLSGGTVAVVAGSGPYVPSTVYTIVTAGAGFGNTVFAGLTSDFAFLAPRLDYGANSVTLTLDKIPFGSAALTANQISVARGLDGLGAGDPLFDAVLSQNFDGARLAFDAASGEAHAFAPATAYTSARLVQGSLLNRLRQAPAPAASLADRSLASLQPVAVAPSTPDPYKATVWGEGFGSWGTVNADGNAAGLDSTTSGFVIGADTALDETYRIGVAGGFTRTTFDIDGRLSSGSNESVFGALYGSAGWGGVNLRLGTSLAAHDVEVDRTVVFPGFADRTEASYDGWTAQAFGEIGYRVGLGRAALEPFAGASFLHLHLDDFVEEGGAAALTGYTRDYHLGTTTLGLRAEAQVSADMPLVVRGAAGWRHAYGDVAPTSLQAFGNGASAFTVSGVPGDRNALVAEAGLDWQASADISVGVAYQGQVGSRVEDHAVKGSFRWKF